MQIDTGLKEANKVVVIGCSGSGKTTLSKKIAQKLEVIAVDLDTIRFVDGFTSDKRPVEDFIEDVRKITAKEKWVIEGLYYNYKYDIEKELWQKADAVIWLDLPLWLIEYRAWKRSIKRIITKQTKPGGLPVGWKTEFSKNGLLRGIHKIHKDVRHHYPLLLSRIEHKTTIIRIRNLKEYRKISNAIE